MSGERIHKLVMPKWGLSMTEGTVAKWLVDEEAEVAPGAELVDIETEKISSAAEAPAAGLLRRKVAKEGEVVPVSGLLGVIADRAVPDSEIEAFIADFLAHFVPEEAQEEAMGPAPEKVQLGASTLRYLKKGEGGDPVLLIHGFGGDLNNWLFNHDALAEKRAVYALDLPGHGESSKDIGDVSWEALARVVVAFMDALEIPRAHLVGHSLGGVIALNAALAHPSRASSLALISSAGLGPEINVEYIEGFIAAGRRRQIKPYLEKLFADPSRLSRQLVDDILKFKRLDGVDRALRAFADLLVQSGKQTANLRDRLAELSLPVLVLWGSQDQIIPAAHAARLPSSIKVEVIEDAGHMVQMEAASKVNQMINRFFG